MSRPGLLARSAVPLGLIVLAHSWSAKPAEIKPKIAPILASNSQASAGGEHKRSISEIIHQQGEKPERRQLVVPSAIGRKRDRHEKLILLAAADKSGEGASRRIDSQSRKSSQSRQTKPLKPATLPGATAALAAVPESSTPPANSFTSGEQERPLRRSPSILQMLEGREQDLIIAAAIAVAFFSVGWLCGGMYYLRRDRIRRTKLRF